MGTRQTTCSIKILIILSGAIVNATGLVRRTLARSALPRRLRLRLRLHATACVDVCDVARRVISACNVCAAAARPLTGGTARRSHTDSRRRGASCGAAPSIFGRETRRQTHGRRRRARLR